jgi:DNA phosphorothioation-dependent restriction protein DptG
MLKLLGSKLETICMWRKFYHTITNILSVHKASDFGHNNFNIFVAIYGLLLILQYVLKYKNCEPGGNLNQPKHVSLYMN